MIQVIFGNKIDQTQKFLSDGTRIPVTEIAVPDNTVVQVKTLEKDKYTSLQIGLGTKKKPTKALLGHGKKAGLGKAPQTIKEIRIAAEEIEKSPKVGDFLKIEEIFTVGDIVDVTGTSKGKGFAGVVKRHGFRGGPKTHGQSDRERAPGSIGQTTTPGRVYRGKRMAGRMGHEVVTIQNLKIVEIDAVNKKIFVSGVVPGVKNSLIRIVRTGKNKKSLELYKKEEPKEAKAAVEEVKVVVEPAIQAPEVVVETKVEAKVEEKNETKEVKPAVEAKAESKEEKGEKI